ncbi:hypothetical protein [Streptomyces eurocidicus]|uniref:Phage tail protein n=1 Tax=Streptomyces eurocidicus TaxID=66423 RepID=A0A7W8BGY1_STREU|nr:hypothetical protein [Streptomyces eurocidicus]MBB5123234.1 hypothetical protein [Streptomyces eurocidicus]MBF6056175.1 hypothetical protein [Streptomyces eurocidicus]
MANDSSKIRFAPNGSLYMAPAPRSGPGSTVLPVDAGDGKSAPAGYQGCGWIDSSGVTITPSIETDPVNVWQSAVPVMYTVKSASFKIKATLMETNELTTSLFFGAEWKPLKDAEGKHSGTYRLDLSSTPELNEVSVVTDWSQKGVLYRCVIPRAMISDRGAIQLQRTENNKYELTIDALDHEGGLGYVLTTDDILGLGKPSVPVEPDPFKATVTVPGFASNDAAKAAWTAKVAVANTAGPAVVSLLRADKSAFDEQVTATKDGTVDVTVPQGMKTAEFKITHGGASTCFQVTDTAQTGTSKACYVLAT